MNNHLSRSSLITIYKSFVRPHLDYGHVIFDKVYDNSFQQRLISLQYKSLLAIAGAITGSSSTERLYQELGLESLQNRQWFRKFQYFIKLLENSLQNIYMT